MSINSMKDMNYKIINYIRFAGLGLLCLALIKYIIEYPNNDYMLFSTILSFSAGIILLFYNVISAKYRTKEDRYEILPGLHTRNRMLYDIIRISCIIIALVIVVYVAFFRAL